MQCSQNQWPAVTGFEPLHGEPTQSLLLLSLPNAFAPNIEGKKKVSFVTLVVKRYSGMGGLIYKEYKWL